MGAKVTVERDLVMGLKVRADLAQSRVSSAEAEIAALKARCDRYEGLYRGAEAEVQALRATRACQAKGCQEKPLELMLPPSTDGF